jgi:hypothetical protein
LFAHLLLHLIDYLLLLILINDDNNNNNRFVVVNVVFIVNVMKYKNKEKDG